MEIRLKFRTACQDRQAWQSAINVCPKDTAEWREEVLNRNHVNHNYSALNHSIMLPINKR